MAEEKKITIITCTLNSSKYLNVCLDSVINQSYKKIEHIFIDGGSTDDTIAIIKQHYPQASLYPQPGRGLYDALNEGLKRATGDIIGFLHSDDLFTNDNCLQRIIDAYEKDDDIDFFCSRMIVYSEDLTEIFATLGGPPHKTSWRELLYSSNYYAHPSYYISAKIASALGLFNTSYHLAADIDWLKRLEKISKKYIYDPKPLVKFRTGGIASQHYFRALKEEFIIMLKLDGFSFKILVIYLYHFLRRVLKFILNKLGFLSLIKLSRRCLNGFKK